MSLYQLKAEGEQLLRRMKMYGGDLDELIKDEQAYRVKVRDYFQNNARGIGRTTIHDLLTDIQLRREAKQESRIRTARNG